MPADDAYAKLTARLDVVAAEAKRAQNVQLSGATRGSVMRDDKGAMLDIYQPPPKSRPPGAIHKAYVILNDDSSRLDLEGDSYTSTVNGRSGPTFNGTAGVAYPWYSVGLTTGRTGPANVIKLTKTAVGAGAGSRTVRLRVIIDEITIYPWTSGNKPPPYPDVGPNGSIVLEEEPLASEPLGSIQTFYFWT